MDTKDADPGLASGTATPVADGSNQYLLLTARINEPLGKDGSFMGASLVEKLHDSYKGHWLRSIALICSTVGL
jgi:hypothetical protein